MSYTGKYFEILHQKLDELLKTQEENIKALAIKLVDTVESGGKVFFFGCSHAGILAQEAFYRTGGLVIANPILPKGLTLDTGPVTDTSVLERKSEYAHEILNSVPISKGDLLVIHSVSGRNGVPVEMAIEARKRGIYTVAITSVKYSSAQSSRHESGKRLFEVCDMVIDNVGEIGDAVLTIDGFAEKTAPTSTIMGAAIINSLCAESVAEFLKRGIDPPVFRSANLDGGDEYNARMFEKYKDRITYM